MLGDAQAWSAESGHGLAIGRAALVQLLCRVTKLGWFDTDAHHEIVKDVSKFLQASPAHYFQGLKIFNQLTTEMNQPTPGRSLTLHRKTAVSFRDASLFHIFPVGATVSGCSNSFNFHQMARPLAGLFLWFDTLAIVIIRFRGFLASRKITSTA